MNRKPQDTQRTSGAESEAQKTQQQTQAFVATPSASDLKPTEREAFLLDTLWKWHEASAKSRTVLGEPLGS